MEKRAKTLEDELVSKEASYKEELCLRDKRFKDLEIELSNKDKRIETLENKLNLLMVNKSNNSFSSQEGQCLNNDLLIIDTDC